MYGPLEDSSRLLPTVIRHGAQGDYPPFVHPKISRDFIYIDDVVAVMRWMLDSSAPNGIFNVGTGKAESFRDMITSMFKAMGRAPNIEYVDMPENIRGQYQYFTQGSVDNLRRAGYNAGFTPLDTAVEQYVTRYLDQADRYR